MPVQFEFIKKLDDTSYCKDWLHIEPYTGFIKPGIYQIYASSLIIVFIKYFTFFFAYFELFIFFFFVGEKCDIKLEVYVDKKTACKLNSGEDKLYDILVLHLEGGKDIFITVTGMSRMKIIVTSTFGKVLQ